MSNNSAEFTRIMDMLYKSNSNGVAIKQHLINEPDRFDRFSRSFDGILLDFSRVAIDSGDFKNLMEEEEDLMDDTKELEALIKAILEANPKEVESYRAGKEVLIEYFVGQLMRKTKGKASPEISRKLLKKLLSS